MIKHEHRTMEAFLDDTFGPIEDFFEDDYLRWYNDYQIIEDFFEEDYLRAAVDLLHKVERIEAR